MKAARVRNAELAEECDVTVQAVGDWLRTGRIAYRHFPEICKLLDCSIEWLATGRKEPRPEAYVAAAHLDLASLRLITAIQSLPRESRAAVKKVVDSFVKSAPWDGQLERRKKT